MTPLDLPELAKPKEVAAYLRVSVNAVYDAVNRENNPLPVVRLGPHGLRVTREHLATWLGLADKSESAGHKDSAELESTLSGGDADEDGNT